MDFGYPAIVKPRTATGADGIRLVRNAAGLRARVGGGRP